MTSLQRKTLQTQICLFYRYLAYGQGPRSSVLYQCSRFTDHSFISGDCSEFILSSATPIVVNAKDFSTYLTNKRDLSLTCCNQNNFEGVYVALSNGFQVTDLIFYIMHNSKNS